MDRASLAIVLYFLALTLAVVDVFVPSGGMLLVLAAAAAVGAILFGFCARTTLMGMSMLTVVAASIPLLAAFAIRIWPKTPIGKRIILGLPPETPVTPETARTSLQDLLGKVVVAEYPLMPAGQLIIDHTHVNALAESRYIEAGERVEVIAIRERNLIVRITTKPLSQIMDSRVLPRGRETSDDPVVAKNESLLDVPAEELGLNSLDEYTLRERFEVTQFGQLNLGCPGF